MKILHINETFAPVGGVETYLLELLPRLEAKGHENVVIYQKTHTRMQPTKGKRIYYVPFKTHESASRLAYIVRREKPTVIYLHMVNDPAIIKQAAQLAPTVSYIHIFTYSIPFVLEWRSTSGVAMKSVRAPLAWVVCQ